MYIQLACQWVLNIIFKKKSFSTGPSLAYPHHLITDPGHL